MNLYKLTLAASMVFASLAADAQIKSNVQAPKYGVTQFNGTLSINNFRNLPDVQLRKIGERVSANTYPTVRTAQQLLKKADVKKSAQRRAGAVAEQHMYSANYVPDDTLFWESFEDWDGETMPYISTKINNWATNSSVANLAPYLAVGMCPTWTTYKGDGYYIPYAKHGDCTLVCMYGGEVYSEDGKTVIAQAPEQDEWLVSPTVTGISKTNFLSFDICYSPWNTHFFISGKDSVFDMNRIAYDVEVLVTTSTRSVSYNEESYTKVFKLSEVVDNYIASLNLDNREDVASLQYMTWKHVQIPLSDFDGSNIRVALRYKGTKGGSVLIDGIRVSDLLPVARYDIPKGAFYWGFSNEMYSYVNDQNPVKAAFIPAYVPSIWNNLSNDDAMEFAWTYSLDGTNTVQSAERNLAMSAVNPSALIEMPKLVANSGNRTDEIIEGVFNVGGNTQLAYNNGQTVLYNVGNYDLTKSWWKAEVGQQGSGCYAFGTGSGSFWASNSNYRYNNVDGIANYYEKPLAPYVFNEVTLPLGDYLNFGAKLACTIYKVDADGIVSDEIIAQSVYNPNAANPTGSCTQVPNTAGMYLLKFVFPEALVIDEPIFICIDGFNNSNMMAIAPIAQAMNHDNEMGYAFVKLNTQSNGYAFVEVAGALAGVDGGSNMNVSHCIGLNAVFPYLHSADGDVFAVADGGETKSFNIDTYWGPADWKIETSASWIKAEKIVDDVNLTASVRITADALPEGMEGRNAAVKISALGCSETISVLQGNATTDINGVFAAEDTIEGTFTLSGQRINSADAKNGIFIVKKNGKMVKVIR